MDFTANLVNDLSPLADKLHLTSLVFGQNFVEDLFPLAGLPELRRLRLPDNKVVDIAALLTLEKLLSADLRGNPLSAASIDLIPTIARRITF